MDDSCQPDWESIYASDEGVQDVISAVQAFDLCVKILNWVDEGTSHKAKSTRLRVARFFLKHDWHTQSDIGALRHVGKAAISRVCREFASDFRFDDTLLKAVGLRDNRSVRKFSALCTERHKRKEQSKWSYQI